MENSVFRKCQFLFEPKGDKSKITVIFTEYGNNTVMKLITNYEHLTMQNLVTFNKTPMSSLIFIL